MSQQSELHSSLLTFLLNAKRNTYAALQLQGVVAPLVPGTAQIEYAEGEYIYRDIYVGFSPFAGQEMVFRAGVPVWSQVYYGKLVPTEGMQADAETIYSFLRAALREVEAYAPYRGPGVFLRDDFSYTNTVHGTLEAFEGEESIAYHGSMVYTLSYRGGLIGG